MLRQASLLLFLFFVVSKSSVLPPLPQKAGLPSVGLIIVQGASISADKYEPLGKAIQDASPFSLWVGIPQFPLSLALPPLIEHYVKDIRSELQKAGLPTNSPVFLSGHSLGSTIQDYLFNTSDHNIVGQILMAGPIRRQFYGTPFPVPTLTVSGELDGLMRMSRMAEAVYHQQLSTRATNPIFDYPVVIVEGMNHMQFASGEPPSTVKDKDLRPDISEEQAHAVLGKIIASFMSLHAPNHQGSTQDARAFLSQQVSDTIAITHPLLLASQLEGSPHIKRQCNSDTPSPQCPFYPAWPKQDKDRTPSNDTDCFCGCEWTNKVVSPSMVYMDGHLDSARFPLHTVDAIHDVTDTKPYHHPHLWTNCTSSPLPCLLNVTTVSQPVYDSFDDYDTGFTHAAAKEIRVKMKSRQVITRATTDPFAELKDTDSGNVCAAINQKAIQYALDNASPVARARFEKYGTPMVVGDDKFPPLPIGPLWIYHALEYNSVSRDGKKVLEVSSVGFKTDLTGLAVSLYPDSDGYHYCKILSPARAMEWLYTDGLRENMPI